MDYKTQYDKLSKYIKQLTRAKILQILDQCGCPNMPEHNFNTYGSCIEIKFLDYVGNAGYKVKINSFELEIVSKGIQIKTDNLTFAKLMVNKFGIDYLYDYMDYWSDKRQELENTEIFKQWKNIKDRLSEISSYAEENNVVDLSK